MFALLNFNQFTYSDIPSFNRNDGLSQRESYFWTKEVITLALLRLNMIWNMFWTLETSGVVSKGHGIYIYFLKYACNWFFLIYTYVGTRQRNRRSCPTSKQHRWSFHSLTLILSSLLQDTHVKSIFCLRIDIKMLKYHLFDVTSLGSRDPKVTKNQWLHGQFRTQFHFLSLVLLNSSLKVHVLVFLLCFRKFFNRKLYSHIECSLTVRIRKIQGKI